ncbi:MAG: lysylphosphatidylglycerol synthase transmembrane domain-containing protein [Lachnospiraceae bacterium]|nr:lysylphosphatidylglycerol synthase transmembrane domain-containing protein [Lachnospiraceae bacterium]
MNNKKKVLFNAAIFILVFALTLWGVFHGEDLGEMRDAIYECRLVWLLPAVVCVFIFIWGESMIIWDMMCSYGIKLKKGICFLFSSVGFFFSCVTPSASGGQPMQIYFMKKEKIPIPISTVVLMIVTITYKMVLVIIGLGIVLFARGFMEQYLGGILPVFYLGLGLNIFCVTFMILLVFHPFLAKQILVKGLWILEKLHLLKHREGRLTKLEASMDMYHETADYMRGHSWLMIRVLAITFVQRIALFAVTCFVYRAFGLSGTGWMTVLTLQSVISVSVDMLPLPGGMGISETLFLAIFPPVFGDLILPGMVLSRGLGYYTELLVSAVFTLVSVVVFERRVKRRQEAEKMNGRRCAAR